MKKKSRLHEFEKNNRVINIEQARQERRTRLDEQKQKNGIVPAVELDIVEKTKKRKVKINYFRLAIIVGVLLLIAYFGVSALRIVQLEQEKEEVTAYNEELQRTKENLTNELENVNLPDYIEGQAREGLKLVKPNELLFIFQYDNLEEEKETDDGESKPEE